jgi:hypothetical protein
MSTARYVRWQDGEMWLGYFEQYPDYLTQSESRKTAKKQSAECSIVRGRYRCVPRKVELRRVFRA